MTTTVWTDEVRARLEDYLSGDRYIPVGLGTKKEACSMAAINLALTGELTDEIPGCMSEVIGRWIPVVQDSMSEEVRNAREWRELLPLAAGTGREREEERLGVVLDWMWNKVLPCLQQVADKGGYGDEWRRMCYMRTGDAAGDAEAAAWAAARTAVRDAAGDAAWDARADAATARAAVRAAGDAARTGAGDAAWASAGDAAGAAAWAAGDAAEAAAWDAGDAAGAAAWEVFDPIGALRAIIEA